MSSLTNFTALVFGVKNLGDSIVSLVRDHGMPEEGIESYHCGCGCCSPEWILSEAAEALPTDELEGLVKSLIISPTLRNHQVLHRAAALGAITLSGDPEDIHGWNWTPAGLAVAKWVVGDMHSDGLICPDCGTILGTLSSSDHRVFCCWDRAADLSLIRDEDTGEWSSPEGFQWRHTFGVRLPKELR